MLWNCLWELHIIMAPPDHGSLVPIFLNIRLEQIFRCRLCFNDFCRKGPSLLFRAFLLWSVLNMSLSFQDRSVCVFAFYAYSVFRKLISMNRINPQVSSFWVLNNSEDSILKQPEDFCPQLQPARLRSGQRLHSSTCRHESC